MELALNFYGILLCRQPTVQPPNSQTSNIHFSVLFSHLKYWKYISTAIAKLVIACIFVSTANDLFIPSRESESGREKKVPFD